MKELILVPTAAEAERLTPKLDLTSHRDPSVANRYRVELCGFGPIAAAATTARLIAQTKPQRVVLIGLAGTYCEPRLPVGSATAFDEVVCHGVGVGSGDQHRSAAEIGWHQIDATADQTAIGQRLRLDQIASRSVPHDSGDRVLLTCCAASADANEAADRARRHPDAVAEDMEGFAVALSCAQDQVPCVIIRGICNQAGDRDHDRWKIDEAITSAAILTRALL